MREREPDWAIVKFYNHDPDRNSETDLLIVREYQWTPQGNHYSHKWEYVARGLKSNEEALKWVSLFKE